MIRDTVEAGIPLAPVLSQGRGLPVAAVVVVRRRAPGQIHLVVNSHLMVTEAGTKVNKSMSFFTET
ncbi:hypothetical protein TSMEX_011615 [Taenia solium]|eukprot:TsM_001216000 transcript=TsM_001216000 gene=TsM_001216000